MSARKWILMVSAAAGVRRLILAVLAVGCAAFCGLALSTSALALNTHVSGSSIGAPGSGNGQFDDPVAVAVDDSTEPLSQPAAGDVYVADHGNRRVERFSATGEYLGQFNGSGTYEVIESGVGKVEHGTAAPTGQFTPMSLAIDSSGALGDPSAGDVYVLDSEHDAIDKFSASGAYEGQLTGTCEASGPCAGSEIPFYQPFAVAVDSAGDLWVAEGEELLQEKESESKVFVSEFSDTGSFIKRVTAHRPPGVEGTNIEAAIAFGALAIDAEGSLYELNNEGPLKINSSTGLVEYNLGRVNGHVGNHSRLGDNAGLGIAFSPSTGRLLFAESSEGGTVSEYGVGSELSSTPLATFGAGSFTGEWGENLQGIAVSAAGTVYVTEPETGRVLSFVPAVLPNVTTEPASRLTETAATLNGTVNPSGVPLTGCVFEYATATAYDEKGFQEAADEPCATTPSGSESISVSSKELTGLTPAAEYVFRLRVANAQGVSTGEAERFTTLAPLVVGGESFSGVGSESVTVAAEVTPGGREVSYHFEYGTTAGYGFSTGSVEVQPGYQAIPVHVQVNGLLPETLYHFRVVVDEAGGGAQAGADMVFSTYPRDFFGLPDDRGYEMVTPLENYEANVNLLAGWPEVQEAGRAQGLYRAAANGDSVMYMSGPTVGGKGNNGNAMLATRSASGGWTQQNLQPVAVIGVTAFASISEGLENGVIFSNTPLVAGAPSNADYVWNTGVSGLELLPGSWVEEADEGGAQLVEQAEPKRLYEIAGGVESPVGVLPDGQLAGTSEFSEGHGALSSNGSRVVWSSEGALYLRDMQTDESVQLDASQGGTGEGGGGKLWGASTDDSKVYFTDTEPLTSGSTATASKPDLYECVVVTVAGRLSCELRDLTEKLIEGEHANVRGVLGVSPNGEYVYFVADGALASGASEQQCKKFEAVLCNLYLYHDGETRFVTALSSQYYEDPTDWERVGETAQVSASGSIVFMSNQSLTGYDNYGDACLQPGSGETASGGCEEIYVYDPSGAGSIACASCRQSGEPPIGNWGDGSFLPSDGSVARPTRWISENGAMVFFDSGERLVPQDENGEEDVYEWEREGNGSCHRSSGCVYLLSSGAGTSPSFLLDASANGSDVFIISRDPLVDLGQAHDYDVYDARIGGSFNPIVPPACTGTGCQGLPGAPPTFATPSSVTFNGVGNFPPPTTKPQTVQKTKSKITKCKTEHAKKKHSCDKTPKHAGKKRAKRQAKAKSRQKRSAKGRK